MNKQITTETKINQTLKSFTFWLSIVLFLLGGLVSIFSNELKQKILTMNILPFISVTLIVASGCLVAYQFYIRAKAEINFLKKRSNEDYEMICHLYVKLKFYDACYNKYLDMVPGGSYGLHKGDEEIFEKEEIKYLQEHINELEALYINQRGRNKVANAFTHPFK